MFPLLFLACTSTATSSDTTDGHDSADGHDTAVGTAAPKNLIVIGIDTLRADHVGALSGVDFTPHLDGVLADATLAQDQRSCANWTFASLVCFWGGADGAELGFVPQSGTVEPSPAPDDLDLVPRFLAEQGYETALVGASPWFSPPWGLFGAFDYADAFADWKADEVVDNALTAVDELAAGDAPFFLHVHFLDPHTPWEAPEAYEVGVDHEVVDRWGLDQVESLEVVRASWSTLTEQEQEQVLDTILALYAAEVRYTDAAIGTLWEGLEERGVLDDSVVVIWSDHGEQFKEHGGFGHGDALHGEEADTLGAVWARGRDGRAWAEPVSSVDLLPTALSWMQLETPTFTTGLPIGEAEALRPRYSVRAEGALTRQSVDVGTRRLHHDWGQQTYALYDLANDPLELVDLTQGDGQVPVELKELLDARADQIQPLL